MASSTSIAPDYNVAAGVLKKYGSVSVCISIGSSYSEELGREICSMAKLVYGLHQSLDGYVDHMALGPPAPGAFRHFIELMRGLTGVIYGRRMYEIMRYWDEDLPDWDAEDHDFAAAWRSRPKWVVSSSLKSLGPNATLVAEDFEKVVRALKAELAGEIHVGGPVLAQSLTEAGLIDEYRLYLRPVVLGGGTPFFAGPRPPLHLAASDLIADGLIRLTYVPA
jgi:dihydrofolate reductase